MPTTGCRSITARSSDVRGPALWRIASGVRISPMSWKSAPNSSASCWLVVRSRRSPTALAAAAKRRNDPGSPARASRARSTTPTMLRLETWRRWTMRWNTSASMPISVRAAIRARAVKSPSTTRPARAESWATGRVTSWASKTPPISATPAPMRNATRRLRRRLARAIRYASARWSTFNTATVLPFRFTIGAKPVTQVPRSLE